MGQRPEGSLEFGDYFRPGGCRLRRQRHGGGCIVKVGDRPEGDARKIGKKVEEFGVIALDGRDHRVGFPGGLPHTACPEERASPRRQSVYRRIGRPALSIVLFTTAMLIPAASVRPAPPQADREAASNLLDIAGERFRVHRTEHFLIAYDAPYESLRPLVGRLEGTYDAVRRLCAEVNEDAHVPQRLLQVILFDRYEDYTAYSTGMGAPAGSTVGIYDPQTNIAAFVNMRNSPDLKRITHQVEQVRLQLKRCRQQNRGSRAIFRRGQDLQQRLSTLRMRRDNLVKRFNRFVVQHEIAHQTFFNLGVHARGADNPNWLVEGLACQFEVPQAAATKPMARVNQVRLADFRNALGVSPKARSVSDDIRERALANGKLIPLVDLILGPGRVGGRGGKDVLRYAQAWALVYYLNRRHHDAFVAYLRRLGARRPGRTQLYDRPEGQSPGRRELDEFRSAFGDPDDAFQRDWISYILKLRFDPRKAGQ